MPLEVCLKRSPSLSADFSGSADTSAKSESRAGSFDQTSTAADARHAESRAAAQIKSACAQRIELQHRRYRHNGCLWMVTRVVGRRNLVPETSQHLAANEHPLTQCATKGEEAAATDSVPGIVFSRPFDRGQAGNAQTDGDPEAVMVMAIRGLSSRCGHARRKAGEQGENPPEVTSSHGSTVAKPPFSG